MSGVQPLTIEVVNDELCIRIGVGTLGVALTNSPNWSDDKGPQLTVKDPVKLAKEIAQELTRQTDETGETRVTEMLMAAAEAVVWDFGTEAADWREGE